MSPQSNPHAAGVSIAAESLRNIFAEYCILNLRRRELEVRRDPGLVGEDEYGYRYLQVIPTEGFATPLAVNDSQF